MHIYDSEECHWTKTMSAHRRENARPEYSISHSRQGVKTVNRKSKNSHSWKYKIKQQCLNCKLVVPLTHEFIVLYPSACSCSHWSNWLSLTLLSVLTRPVFISNVNSQNSTYWTFYWPTHLHHSTDISSLFNYN